MKSQHEDGANSQQASSDWSHVRNILTLCLPIGHTFGIFAVLAGVGERKSQYVDGANIRQASQED